MTDRHRRWVGRPRTAMFVRVLVALAPAVVGVLVAWATASVLPEVSGWLPTLGWWTALIGVTVGAVVLTQRAARRLLPLSWLLTLTLLFPDQAPSRLLTAHRAARRRSLDRILESARRDGLGDTAQEAAAQAIVLVTALGEHDRRTRGHSERVRGFADVLAEEAGISAADRDKLRWAALLHDIGKLAVPGEILNKPGQPNAEEWATLQRHPAEGGRLVEPLETWLGPWARTVAEHHEHWDGTGYPQGLAGEEISLGGRILAVADAYEVMTAARAYKQPLRPEAARRALVADAGTHFDPVLVRHFLSVGLGRLWPIIGISAFLSLLPWLAKLWTAPAGASVRRTGTGPAVAVAAVAGLTLAGAVGPAEVTPRPGAPVAVEAVTGPGAAVNAPEEPSAEPPPTEEAAAPVTAGEAVVTPVTDPDRAPLHTAPPEVEVDTAPPPPGEGPDTAGPPAPEGDPVAPALPPSPGLYSARGQLVAPALLGLNEGALQFRCGPSGSLGLDAVVFELPAVHRVAGAPVRVTAQSLLGNHHLRVAFYSEGCDRLGEVEAPGAEATGALPAGTAYVVVSDRSGLVTAVELTVG